MQENQNEETGPSVDQNQTDKGSGQEPNLSESTTAGFAQVMINAEAPAHGNLLETSAESTATETKEYSQADGSQYPTGSEELKGVQFWKG